MEKNDGGPAFPSEERYKEGDEWFVRQHPGMSLRDWFAGQALIGMFAAGIHMITMDDNKIAKSAYVMADAMLAAREK